jgi:hypothetical protein
MPKTAKEVVPAAPAMAMSAEMAALLNSKIAEFESTQAEASEKTQKLEKGKAKATAKTKTKEAKKLFSGTDSDRVLRLWERLQLEHDEADGLTAEAYSRQKEIADTEQKKEGSQLVLQKTLAVKGKLESLCRQLQTQTKALVEERRQLTENERDRRQKLADEFQNTIGDVKTTMEQQAAERTRLAKENEDLRSHFKSFFEQYDKREKDLVEQQKVREVEVGSFERKLSEQAQLYRQEATREATAKHENDELVSTETALRGQLQTYSTKFNHFQDALSKSDKVLGQYKRQRNKMQRRVEVLEKENVELRSKNERRINIVSKDRNTALKEKESMQERCKSLQSERQRLIDEVQRLS